MLTQNSKMVSPANAEPSLSRATWGLDWGQHFPAPLCEKSQVWADISDYQTVVTFAQEHFPQIYRVRPETGFQWFEVTPAKSRYYQKTCDFFAMRHDGHTAGVCVAQPSDWSTYYLRNISVAQAFQGQGLYQAFLTRLIHALRTSSIERLDVDLSPQNASHIHVLNKFGFIVTSMVLSERWGAMTRFTKFLSPLHLESFSKQFTVQDFGPSGMELGNDTKNPSNSTSVPRLEFKKETP